MQITLEKLTLNIDNATAIRLLKALLEDEALVPSASVEDDSKPTGASESARGLKRRVSNTEQLQAMQEARQKARAATQAWSRQDNGPDKTSVSGTYPLERTVQLIRGD